MSQLSIGIDIRKSDLKRDVAGVRQILRGLDKDIASSSKQRATSEARMADKLRAQIERRKEQHAARMVAADQKIARENIASQKRIERTKEQSARRIERIQLRSADRQAANERRVQRNKDRIDRQAFNTRMRETRDKMRVDRVIHRARIKEHKESESRSRGRAAAVFKPLRGASGMLGTGVKYGIGALGLGGAALAAASVSSQLGIQGGAAALATQAKQAGDPRGLKEIQSSILGQAAKESKGGRDRSEIIAGLRSFQEVSGGEFSEAQRQFAMVAETADASDAALSDVAQAAGNFARQLRASGLTGKELDSELDRVLRSGMGLSALGSLEFKDIAKNSGRIVAASGRVEGSQAQAIIDTMSLTQLAMLGGAASGEEATTGAQRLTDDFIARHKNLKRSTGVDPFQKDANGRDMGLRPLRELVLEVVNKSKGDPKKLVALFGERGRKPLENLFKLQRGDKSGLSGDASRAAQGFLTGEVSAADRAAQAEFIRAQAGRELNAAFEELYESVGTQLIPTITKDLVPALKELAPHAAGAARVFSSLVDSISSDPGTALSGAIAVAIGAQIASSVVQAEMAKSIGAGLSASLAVAGVGIIIAGAIASAIDSARRDVQNQKTRELVLAGDIEGAKKSQEEADKIGKNEPFGGIVKKIGSILPTGIGENGVEFATAASSEISDDDRRALRDFVARKGKPDTWEAPMKDDGVRATVGPPLPAQGYVEAIDAFIAAVKTAAEKVGSAVSEPGRTNSRPISAR